jgi:chromate transporter
MNPFIFFWLVLKSSFFSTSGLGNLPQLYADLTANGMATDRQFAEAIAVGQVSPGPTGLWVISLGYLVDGPRGAALAALAIVIPPAGVLLIAQLYQRNGDHPAVKGFVRGLSLAVVGIFVVVIAGLLRDNGLNLQAFLIVGGAAALAFTRRLPVIAILALAAVVGILVYR